MSWTLDKWRVHKQADGSAFIVATERRDQFGRSAEDIVRMPIGYASAATEKRANIIAASPELLAACKALIRVLDVVAHEHPSELWRGTEYDDAMKAVAKAESGGV